MKREKVLLSVEQRERAVDEIVQSILKRKIELVVIALDRVHLHLLARFPGRNPRHYVGLGKKESSAYMRRDGLAPDGGLWAIKTECVPITDRSHFDSVEKYIQDHQARGAATWHRPVAPSLSELDLSVFLLE